MNPGAWLKRSRTVEILVLTVLFLFSRFLLFTGFPFNPAYLEQGTQLLDTAALEGDLARSLLYLHAQPPLFNALAGIILKLAPGRAAAHAVFQLLYLAIGLFLVLGIRRLARELGASRPWAFAAAALFVFWPPSAWSHLFNHPPAERWLSYDYPMTALLLAMALALAAFMRRGGLLPLFLFLLGGAAAVLTRSMFHLAAFLAPVVLLGWWAARRRDPSRMRTVLLGGLLVLTLAGGWYLKNYRISGWFGGSSLQGMNLSALTLLIPAGRVQEEMREGRISPLAGIPRFSPPEVYLAYYGETARTGVPVLDEVKKGTGGINLNHFIIARASREYQGNALILVRDNPRDAAKAVLNAAYIYFGFQPCQFLWPTYIRPWGFWNIHVAPLWAEGRLDPLRYAVLPLLFAGAYLGTAFLLLRAPREPLPVFLAFALLYVFAVSSLELGINCVFRQQVDPLFFAGAAALAGRRT